MTFKKFVNKTSHDKGRASSNKNQKRCNRILSDITIGQNYATVGYNVLHFYFKHAAKYGLTKLMHNLDK